MKLLNISVVAAAIAIPSFVMAQCPIPCDSESFPYTFCDKLGNTRVVCSTNPNSDTGTVDGVQIGLLPKKSYIPGCVTVIPIDTSLDYQPIQPRPDAPDPPSKYDAFQWNFSPEDYYPDEGWVDEYEWQVCHDQWISDSANFINEVPFTPPDTSDDITYPDSIDKLAVWDQYTSDLGLTYDNYVVPYETYQSDSTSYYNGTDVTYDQVWDNDQANSDAQSSLNAWLGICGLHGDPNCCILIKADNNIKDFKGTYAAYAGHAVNFPGRNVQRSISCGGSGSCPDATTNYIAFNATSSFFYANNTNQYDPNTDYILHPSAPDGYGWFTGQTPPSDIYPIDFDFSFKKMTENAIGYWLGLNAPNAKSDDSVQCPNNMTVCHDTQTVLVQSFQAASAPTVLLHDDSCMFSKLYCPSGSSGVQKVTPQPPDWFDPQVFPNPSNGGMTLTFDVETRSFVQIGIYDMLGKEISAVSSDYDEQGPESISLGTESLPSGNYVCRVRVGDRAAYINIAIVK